MLNEFEMIIFASISCAFPVKLHWDGLSIILSQHWFT